TRVADPAAGRREGRAEIGEQLLALAALAGVAVDRPPANVLDERIEVVGGARRERHFDSVLGQRPRERCAQSRTYAYDERGVEATCGHDLALSIIATMVGLQLRSDCVAACASRRGGRDSYRYLTPSLRSGSGSCLFQAYRSCSIICRDIIFGKHKGRFQHELR